MRDTDEIDVIRERKRERLLERAGSGGGSPTPSAPVHVAGQAEFDATVGRYDVVLVDYHAEWCGPCKLLEPTIDALARETDAAVAKVDIDRNPSLAQQAGVRSVPTLALYADGREVERLAGVQDRAILEDLIRTHAP